MPDPTPTPTPEGSGTQPDDKKTPEGQQPADDKGNSPAPAPDDKPKTFTQEDINRLLAKEKRDWEKKVKDAEDKAKLSEDERTKAELAEAKAALAERDRRDSAMDQAKTAGVKNPKLFYSAYGSELETDAKGNITNFADILATAKAESPELFQAVAGGSADGGDGKGNKPGLTKEQVDKMTPDEINKNWDEVSKFLSSQK
jgi:hypothetical protein